MSLDKAVAHGQEHRLEYRRSEAFDRTCRPHGGKPHGRANACPWCRNRRLYADRKARGLADILIQEATR